MIFFPRCLLTGPYVLCVQPNLALHRHLSHDTVYAFFEPYELQTGGRVQTALGGLSH